MPTPWSTPKPKGKMKRRTINLSPPPPPKKKKKFASTPKGSARLRQTVRGVKRKVRKQKKWKDYGEMYWYIATDCDICNVNVEGRTRFDCTKCETNLCLRCFQFGALYGKHKHKHGYKICKVDDDRPFRCDWPYQDERVLLRLCFRYQVGNWPLITELLYEEARYRTMKDAQKHFRTYFVHSTIGQVAARVSEWELRRRANRLPTKEEMKELRAVNDHSLYYLYMIDALREAKTIPKRKSKNLKERCRSILDAYMKDPIKGKWKKVEQKQEEERLRLEDVEEEYGFEEDDTWWERRDPMKKDPYYVTQSYCEEIECLPPDFDKNGIEDIVKMMKDHSINELSPDDEIVQAMKRLEMSEEVEEGGGSVQIVKNVQSGQIVENSLWDERRDYSSKVQMERPLLSEYPKYNRRDYSDYSSSPESISLSAIDLTEFFDPTPVESMTSSRRSSIEFQEAIAVECENRGLPPPPKPVRRRTPRRLDGIKAEDEMERLAVYTNKAFLLRPDTPPNPWETPRPYSLNQHIQYTRSDHSPVSIDRDSESPVFSEDMDDSCSEEVSLNGSELMEDGEEKKKMSRAEIKAEVARIKKELMEIRRRKELERDNIAHQANKKAAKRVQKTEVNTIASVTDGLVEKIVSKEKKEKMRRKKRLALKKARLQKEQQQAREYREERDKVPFDDGKMLSPGDKKTSGGDLTATGPSSHQLNGGKDFEKRDDGEDLDRTPEARFLDDPLADNGQKAAHGLEVTRCSVPSASLKKSAVPKKKKKKIKGKGNKISQKKKKYVVGRSGRGFNPDESFQRRRRFKRGNHEELVGALEKVVLDSDDEVSLELSDTPKKKSAVPVPAARVPIIAAALLRQRDDIDATPPALMDPLEVDVSIQYDFSSMSLPSRDDGNPLLAVDEQSLKDEEEEEGLLDYISDLVQPNRKINHGVLAGRRLSKKKKKKTEKVLKKIAAAAKKGEAAEVCGLDCGCPVCQCQRSLKKLQRKKDKRIEHSAQKLLKKIKSANDLALLPHEQHRKAMKARVEPPWIAVFDENGKLGKMFGQGLNRFRKREVIPKAEDRKDKAKKVRKDKSVARKVNPALTNPKKIPKWLSKVVEQNERCVREEKEAAERQSKNVRRPGVRSSQWNVPLWLEEMVAKQKKQKTEEKQAKKRKKQAEALRKLGIGRTETNETPNKKRCSLEIALDNLVPSKKIPRKMREKPADRKEPIVPVIPESTNPQRDELIEEVKEEKMEDDEIEEVKGVEREEEKKESPVKEKKGTPVKGKKVSPVKKMESPALQMKESPVKEKTASPVKEQKESPVKEKTESPVKKAEPKVKKTPKWMISMTQANDLRSWEESEAKRRKEEEEKRILEEQQKKEEEEKKIGQKRGTRGKKEEKVEEVKKREMKRGQKEEKIEKIEEKKEVKKGRKVEEEKKVEKIEKIEVKKGKKQVKRGKKVEEEIKEEVEAVEEVVEEVIEPPQPKKPKVSRELANILAAAKLREWEEKQAEHRKQRAQDMAGTSRDRRKAYGGDVVISEYEDDGDPRKEKMRLKKLMKRGTSQASSSIRDTPSVDAPTEETVIERTPIRAVRRATQSIDDDESSRKRREPKTHDANLEESGTDEEEKEVRTTRGKRMVKKGKKNVQKKKEKVESETDEEEEEEKRRRINKKMRRELGDLWIADPEPSPSKKKPVEKKPVEKKEVKKNFKKKGEKKKVEAKIEEKKVEVAPVEVVREEEKVEKKWMDDAPAFNEEERLEIQETLRKLRRDYMVEKMQNSSYVDIKRIRNTIKTVERNWIEEMAELGKFSKRGSVKLEDAYDEMGEQPSKMSSIARENDSEHGEESSSEEEPTTSANPTSPKKRRRVPKKKAIMSKKMRKAEYAQKMQRKEEKKIGREKEQREERDKERAEEKARQKKREEIAMRLSMSQKKSQTRSTSREEDMVIRKTYIRIDQETTYYLSQHNHVPYNYEDIGFRHQVDYKRYLDDLFYMGYNVVRDDLEDELFDEGEDLISQLDFYKRTFRGADQLEAEIKFAKVERYLRLVQDRRSERNHSAEYETITEFLDMIRRFDTGAERRKLREIVRMEWKNEGKMDHLLSRVLNAEEIVEFKRARKAVFFLLDRQFEVLDQYYAAKTKRSPLKARDYWSIVGAKRKEKRKMLTEEELIAERATRSNIIQMDHNLVAQLQNLSLVHHGEHSKKCLPSTYRIPIVLP